MGALLVSVVGAFLALAVVVAGVAVFEFSKKLPEHPLLLAARQLQLSITETAWPSLTMHGVVGRFPVEVKFLADAQSQERSFVFAIDCGQEMPLDLRAGLAKRVRARITGQRDVEVGDEAFDGRFVIDADPRTAYAILSNAVRRSIIALTGFEIYDGKLKLIRLGYPSGSEIVKVVEQLVSLAESMRIVPEAIEERLFVAFRDEENPRTRRIQLHELLNGEFPTDLRAQAVTLAMQSSIPELRLAGALGAGNRGVEVLHELSLNSAVPREMRATALQHLPPSREGDRALIDFLGDEQETVLRAAVEALREVGPLAAVEPLLGHTQGLLKSAELQSEARSAIAAIQTREGHGERGVLSVAEDDHGGSLSEAKSRGMLSTLDADQKD